MSAPEDDAARGLDWSDPSAPRSRRFGDVYYSMQDGLAESRAVFLAGCDLPEAWRSRARFTVAELGFGTGLNIAALLDLWRREGSPGGRLHVFSVEAHPLARADAARALAAWPEIADATEALLARWPPSTPGFHRIDLPEWRATLDLATGDAAWALGAWSGQADAWFLDGFSPALNPAMWSEAVLDGVAARSAPGARLATFTVAGAVRRGLAERGFTVEKRPGFGRKRERLEAVFQGENRQANAPARVAMVGAGIAGASLARAFRSQGVKVSVIEAQAPGAGASGFPASLVTPRLDAGDADIAGLSAQCLIRARTLYDETPGAVITRGVVRLEHGPRDARRFDRIAAQDIWAQDAMLRLSPADVATRLGEPVGRGGLMMTDALCVKPEAILQDWLADVDRINARVARLEPRGGRWAIFDADGELAIEADAVVITAGWGAAGLYPDLSLSPVRGQASWSQGVKTPETGVAWGGYVAPTADGFLFGATHDRGETDTAVRPSSDQGNLESLASVLPVVAAQVTGKPLSSRAAVRAVTPDRLPFAGPLGDRPGLYGLGGLGSRGFLMAPLLGEHLAARIIGAPSPLPSHLASRLAPERFGKNAASS